MTVSFRDYIANVASSEVYPTWPEQALRANILAQSSLALNRNSGPEVGTPGRGPLRTL